MSTLWCCEITQMKTSTSHISVYRRPSFFGCPCLCDWTYRLLPRAGPWPWCCLLQWGPGRCNTLHRSVAQMKWSALHSQTQRHGYLPVLAGLETEDSAKGEKVKSNINTMGWHTVSVPSQEYTITQMESHNKLLLNLFPQMMIWLMMIHL